MLGSALIGHEVAADAARDLAIELLRIHYDDSGLDAMLPLLERDLEYAVAVSKGQTIHVQDLPVEVADVAAAARNKG